MRRSLQLVLLWLLAAGMVRSEIIDRIVATVNGQAVLQSDWETAMRCEAFLDQRPLSFTPDAAEASLQRLVDQQLLLQQLRSYRLAPLKSEDLRNRIQEVRKQIPGAATDSGWRAALESYGLTQSEVESRIADQLEIVRFIDVRLRPTVHVGRRAIEEYYRDTLLPGLKQKGAAEVPLAEVSAKIEEILTQQRLDEQLTELLRDLRQQSEIHIDPSALPRPPANTTAEDRR